MTDEIIDVIEGPIRPETIPHTPDSPLPPFVPEPPKGTLEPVHSGDPFGEGDHIEISDIIKPTTTLVRAARYDY